MTQLTHHAYVVEGVWKNIQEELFQLIESTMEVQMQGNPDVWIREFETLGVDDARELAQAQLRKGFSGTQKIFIISCTGMTTEAQNALLKVFEEPTSDTHFFLIVPTIELLLPTLRSRVETLKLSHKESFDLTEAEKFLTSTPDKRLKYIETIIKEKDITQARSLVNDLEVLIQKHHHKTALEDILMVQTYIGNRGSSLKLLLEHLALVLPQKSI